jgi:hypothetical protein
MPPRKNISDPTFLIDFPLNGQPPHLLPDLTDDEIFALGYVTCQWAFLEHAIFVDTIVRARRAKTTVPADTKNLSFARRLRAWRWVTQLPRIRSPEKQRFGTSV